MKIEQLLLLAAAIESSGGELASFKFWCSVCVWMEQKGWLFEL